MKLKFSKSTNSINKKSKKQKMESPIRKEEKEDEDYDYYYYWNDTEVTDVESNAVTMSIDGNNGGDDEEYYYYYYDVPDSKVENIQTIEKLKNVEEKGNTLQYRNQLQDTNQQETEGEYYYYYYYEEGDSSNQSSSEIEEDGDYYYYYYYDSNSPSSTPSEEGEYYYYYYDSNLPSAAPSEDGDYYYYYYDVMDSNVPSSAPSEEEDYYYIYYDDDAAESNAKSDQIADPPPQSIPVTEDTTGNPASIVGDSAITSACRNYLFSQSMKDVYTFDISFTFMVESISSFDFQGVLAQKIIDNASPSVLVCKDQVNGMSNTRGIFLVHFPVRESVSKVADCVPVIQNKHQCQILQGKLIFTSNKLISTAEKQNSYLSLERAINNLETLKDDIISVKYLGPSVQQRIHHGGEHVAFVLSVLLTVGILALFGIKYRKTDWSKQYKSIQYVNSM